MFSCTWTVFSETGAFATLHTLENNMTSWIFVNPGKKKDIDIRQEILRPIWRERTLFTSDRNRSPDLTWQWKEKGQNISPSLTVTKHAGLWYIYTTYLRAWCGESGPGMCGKRKRHCSPPCVFSRIDFPYLGPPPRIVRLHDDKREAATDRGRDARRAPCIFK